MDGPVVSYSMSRALELLHDELQKEVEHHLEVQKRNRQFKWFSWFHHASVRTLYHWTTVGLSAILAILLIVAAALTDEGYQYDRIWLILEACVIMIFVGFNVYLTVRITIQERTEFARLLKQALKKLSTCMRYNTWNQTYFPRLEAPQSPCVTLQWTIRDSLVFNMPTPLLVKGDIIVMRPGHKVPARCEKIKEAGSTADSLILNAGDVYTQGAGDTENVFHTPQGRQPMTTQKFRLLDTPFLHSMRKILEDSPRPCNIVQHEKFITLTHWIERRIIPTVLVVMIVTNIVRYVCLNHSIGHWTEVIITLQVQSVVSLIPLIIPSMWFFMNCYGQARVFSAFEAGKGSKSLGDDSFDTDSSISADEARVDLQWGHIGDWFRSVVKGDCNVVTRKINILHILGSVTTLCCVDKKGILSYPNPSPEKIFFLRRGQKDKTTPEPGTVKSDPETSKKSPRYNETGVNQSSHVEVLDVSSNAKTSHGLHFDDPMWQTHLSSLKPLGLTILANTCNPDTAMWYTQFADHVACAGLENEETVAVVNRRCLCSLAREIGFSDKALEIFKMEKTLGLYRQVSAEMTTKERLQRAKSFMQHKIPMPNMMSVIVREKISGACQLLSQGTADILLSSCSDYWDGEDLVPLTQSERKKILDFYHRTSIGSFCTSFSYRPVRQNLMGSGSDVYMELPNDSQYLRDCQSSGSVDQDLELMSDSTVWEGQRSFSADSLFDLTSLRSVEDITSMFQSQCNQIFIGMVTMQYQARQDFIQLIDKLEGACIRFVHFSQENEVRSRVFAEKMGLEAGWNCHISLRSENQYLAEMSANNSGPEISQGDLPNRMSRYSSRHSTESYSKGEKPLLIKRPKVDTLDSRSQSAPSIVNLGSSQVKFETKVKTAIVSPRKVKKDMNIAVGTQSTSDESSPLCMGSKDSGRGDFVHIDIEEDILEMDCGMVDDHAWDSDEGLSRQASSYITDNTEDSLAIENRAKLPSGIENIRPHLRSIDNVPLLVNLFTDCMPETTREMISIMQEHGEVVVCVGSSVNMQNVSVFLQADCSLALEPLCPQVCLQQSPPHLLWDKDVPTPLQLASCLLSVTCPILISKDENISLIHLIAEARSHLMSLRNCFYFMMCCSFSVTIVQALASFLQLPPVLAPQHLLWLVLVIIPLLGITMMGNPVDARVMSLATRKNANHVPTDMILRFTVYYLMRFLPPVLIALFCYGITLHSFCQNIRGANNGTACAIYDLMSDSPVPYRSWYEKFSGGIVVAQNILVFLLVFYFVIISISFVHWTDHQARWRQCPATNKLCLTILPIVLCCQTVFSVCDTYIRNSMVSHVLPLSDIYIHVWLIGPTFPIIMCVVNELVKHREIKLAVRYQKRARLDFGTKLGMNSPF